MKKIIYYQAINQNRELTFMACSGRLAEITDLSGTKIQFAIAYDRHEKKYYAVELSTGLTSKPIMNKDPEKVLKHLSEHDINRIINSEQGKMYQRALEDFKNER